MLAALTGEVAGIGEDLATYVLLNSAETVDSDNSYYDKLVNQ